MSSTQVTFLGTNGWYNSPTGDTTCILLDTKNCYIILDAGSGLAKVDRHLKKPKPTYLFLSHFHLDHILGLHVLNKFHFPKGLTIACFKGGERILNQFVAAPFTMPFKDLQYKVTVRELSAGSQNSFPFPVTCAELVHSARCFGYRFELEGKVIAFCTDTGYCPSAIALSRHADLLMAECAYKSGEKVASWPHLNPQLAAQLAREAAVRRLALIHFDAAKYATLGERQKAQKAARKIFKNTFIAQDNMGINV